MKLNRKNKKGFTIVELVIVIAVIGILSAILIPTFTNLTKNAKEAATKEELQNAYTSYVIDASDDTPFETVLAREEIVLQKKGTSEYYVYNTTEKAWDPSAKEASVKTGNQIGVEYNGYYAFARA